MTTPPPPTEAVPNPHTRPDPTPRILAPEFGDVLRIFWTTFYFGADSQWHNARTGAVETPEAIATEIAHAGDDWTWLVPGDPR